MVRILKELPLCVYMTCCRPIAHLQPDLETVAPLAEGISAALKLFEVLTLIHMTTESARKPVCLFCTGEIFVTTSFKNGRAI